MIAPYISEVEYQCPHCGQLPPDLSNYPDVFNELFSAFKTLRETWGKPIPITSGYRCMDHEPSVSGLNCCPHTYGLALDLGIPSDGQTAFLDLIAKNCPDLRVGVNVKPGQTHIHIDVAYLIMPRPTVAYVKGMKWNE